MRKKVLFLTLALFFVFCLNQQALADELSDLKKQLRMMQEQLEMQKRQMNTMQRKIEDMEKEKRTESTAPGEIEERLMALEEKSREPYQAGLLTRKEAKFEIGGELELEFVDTQKDSETEEPNPHFQIDMLRLSPKVRLSRYLSLKADINFSPEEVELAEAFLQFSKLPLGSKLRIGLDDMFIKPDRKTERYPLAANAFWSQEELGIFLKSEFHKPFYLNLSYGNGLELDDKKIGEDDSYRIIAADKRNKDFSRKMEAGIGLGMEMELGMAGKLDVQGFYYHGELSEADIKFLNKNLSGYDSDKDDQCRYGVNVDYTFQNFNLFFQYIKAGDGDLDRYAWYLQPSYDLHLPWGWNYFNIHTFLLRYGRLNLQDIEPVFSDSLTWDRQEITLALISEIFNNLKLKAEYTIDDEDTGNGEVNNNELLIQLEMKF